MGLLFRKSIVRSLVLGRLGETTTLDHGVLTLDAQALAAALQAQDERIAAIKIHAALPGESTRIVCAKDVVQPRVKIDGAEPGMGNDLSHGEPRRRDLRANRGLSRGHHRHVGSGGGTHAVLRIGARRHGGAGPQRKSARTNTRHPCAKPGCEPPSISHRPVPGLRPMRPKRSPWDEVSVDSGLPRIAYVDMVLSQGLLHDTYVLGKNAKDGLPLILDPRAVIDNGVVSGNCVSACDKNTTYHHQHNSVIAELLREHGKRWDFVGVVITNEPTRLAHKERSAARTVDLVKGLDAQAAIITKEGFGNPDADLMMIIAGLERAGIRTVAVTDEYAGADGGSQSLADTTPEADALVSVGNANERN